MSEENEEMCKMICEIRHSTPDTLFTLGRSGERKLCITSSI